MSTLIVLSALPGSGKSTWARKYVLEHKNTYIVSSDEIRKVLFGKINCFKDEKLVWETFLIQLNEHANDPEDVTVIADATNLQNKYRRFYLEQTPGYSKHILVMFDVPFEKCLKQNQMRSNERIVPHEAMLSLKNEFEPLSQEVKDLYDETIIIKDI